MKNRVLIFVLGVAAWGASLVAQTSPLPLPPPVEKELAARASDVTEVTLNKDMLGFASKFMNNKNNGDATIQQLIQGLDGIYVRSYEFDKEGEYSLDEIAKLREYFETSEWTPMVRERERKTGETTDVMVKLVNGESHGIFILTAEPKELTIVLILGPIRMDQLGALKGIGGLGSLGDITKDKDMTKDKDAKDKDTKDRAKTKEKKGGDQ
jgi:hypothetical protein